MHAHTSMNTSSRHKVGKKALALKDTSEPVDLIDAGTFYPQRADYTFLQVHMEHSPG